MVDGRAASGCMTPQGTSVEQEDEEMRNGGSDAPSLAADERGRVRQGPCARRSGSFPSPALERERGNRDAPTAFCTLSHCSTKTWRVRSVARDGQRGSSGRTAVRKCRKVCAIAFDAALT